MVSAGLLWPTMPSSFDSRAYTHPNKSKPNKSVNVTVLRERPVIKHIKYSKILNWGLNRRLIKTERRIKIIATPVSGVTSIKFETRKLQEFAIPTRGITSVKFNTRRSRRDVEIRQQYYIVVLQSGTS